MTKTHGFSKGMIKEPEPKVTPVNLDTLKKGDALVHPTYGIVEFKREETRSFGGSNKATFLVLERLQYGTPTMIYWPKARVSALHVLTLEQENKEGDN